MKKKVLSIILTLVLVLSVCLFPALPVAAATANIEVSQPIQVTDNDYYERGQVIRYDGTNYWLFYGRSDSVTGSYQTDTPDIHDYSVYYKKASSVAGLVDATPQAVPGAVDCYIGEIGAAYVDGNMWTFATVPSTNYGGRKSLYGWYTVDGGTSWNQVADLADDLPNGAAHHDEIGYDGKLYVMANYPDGNIGWHTKYTDDPTTSPIVWSSYVPLAIPSSLINGTGHFFVDGSDLYIGILRTSPSKDNKILQYSVSPESWVELCSAPSTGWDPTLFKVDGRYVFAQAPWMLEGGSDRQHIIAWSSDTLTNVFSGSSVSITEGKYGSNVWVDMWPIGFTDAEGTSYLFYTSERNPDDASSEIDGNIWYLTMDWNVTNDHYTYIKEAVDAATSTTINVAAGTYYEGDQIVIDGDLSIAGEDRTNTIIKPTGDTGSSGDSRGWFLVLDGIEFHLSNVRLDGAGSKIYQAIRHRGLGTIESVDFTEIKYNESGPTYGGVAVAAFGTGPVDITNCTFTEIGRVGVLYFALGGVSSFNNNEYIGKGDGDWLDYALDISAGANVDVASNFISNCQGVASVDGSTSAGILVTTLYGPGTTAAITCNTLTNNTCGIAVGYDENDESTVEAHYNQIMGNTDCGVDSTNPIVHAEYNWWGDRSGPYHPTSWDYDSMVITNPDGQGDTVSDYVLYDPWIGQGGMVTGGGWIYSPVGAYTAQPELEGKATFGFVSRYKKGANVPTGNTEFNFHVADLKFHSNNYDWLVVAGDTARYKGWGTINGAGEYRFMLWAGDDNPDTFRIKIWEEDEYAVETVVYDNGSQQAIGGGNIVIHKK